MGDVRVRDIDAALKRKGFRSEQGSKHTKYHFVFEGHDTGVVTFLSRSYDQYGEVLQSKVARELGLTRGELRDFVDCPLSLEEYTGLLKGRGKI
jgi:hypothetical protein